MKGTYEIKIEGFDWGCGITEVTLCLENPIEIEKDKLVVKETKQVTDFTKIPEFPILVQTFERTIKDVEKINDKEYKVKLGVSPSEGSPLLFSMKTMFNTWSDPYDLTFIADGEKLDLTYAGKKMTSDIFSYDSFTASDGVKLEYAYYEPKEKTDRLVIWLHGLGEGGVDHTDPSVTVMANKVTSLVSDSFQEMMQGTNVLVPQSPTFWMDQDGTGGNLLGGEIKADGTSYYLQSLTELIQMYQKKINAKKTVLSGCSNGGYMTMVMAMHHPEMFDAYVPICEAVNDKYISDEQIEGLKQLPIYFVYSKDDTTVIPENYEIPTIERLLKAGAENVYVSTTDHVIDTSGLYMNKDGTPYKYAGHWSWIYFFNNECDADGLKAWDFVKKYLGV